MPSRVSPGVPLTEPPGQSRHRNESLAALSLTETCSRLLGNLGGEAQCTPQDALPFALAWSSLVSVNLSQSSTRKVGPHL